MKSLIWQPKFTSGYEFKVDLDSEFARRMIKSPVSETNRKRMNEMANEDLKRFGVNWMNPYLFHEGSAFISQFYIGNNGVWLSTSHNNISTLLGDNALEKPVEYHSHNVDRKDQAFSLMFLFDKWIRYADILAGERR